MKRSRFTEEQIIAILREQEAGVPVADLCRKHGLSSPTFYKWKAMFGGVDVSEAQRLKVLEEENAKLKWMLADAMLDNVALKDLLGKMVTSAAHREAATNLQATYEMSQRRACRVMNTDRTSVRYQSTQLLNETPFRSLPHARAVPEAWRRDYNEERPHSKLGWMTPRDYARAICGDTGDRAAQPGGSARTDGLPPN